LSERVSPTAPGEIAVLASAARHYADHGRLDEARDVFAGLIELEPGVSYLHTGLGCVLMRLGCLADALECFQAALRLDPQDVAALAYAGELCLEKGDEAGGLGYLERAIALDSAGESPWALRARSVRARAVSSGGGEGR
jgi:tetratricopeptide (TPR) repeat protein